MNVLRKLSAYQLFDNSLVFPGKFRIALVIEESTRNSRRVGESATLIQHSDQRIFRSIRIQGEFGSLNFLSLRECAGARDSGREVNLIPICQETDGKTFTRRESSDFAH